MQNKNSFIRIFAKHKTAPNLILFLMLILGFFAINQHNTQFLPNYNIDIVTISVEWSGASAGEVEDGIISIIEPEIRFIDGVKKVSSTAREGIAEIAIELTNGTNVQRAYADIEGQIARISNFPVESEKPKVRRIVPYESIGRVLITGPVPESVLRGVAYDLRDELYKKGIDKVNLIGDRKPKILIDLIPSSIHSNEINILSISKKLSETSIDSPSGISKGSERKQVRLTGVRDEISEISNIEIISDNDGVRVTLADVANIYEELDQNAIEGRADGEPALTLRVYRAMGNDALELASILEKTVENSKLQIIPPGVEVRLYDISANAVRDRINLLLKNGAGGLVLVVFILSMFLSNRAVIWVAAGIPASLSAALMIMLLTDQSINMVSLFALIMMIGIIVDDSIVVAEHIQFQRENGVDSLSSAVNGASIMFYPVIAASLTTIAAFFPVFLISGIIGEIIAAIPLVVISVIIASLLECFLVLPGHLHYAFIKEVQRPKQGFKKNFLIKFDSFKNHNFKKYLTLAIEYRHITLSLAIAVLLSTLGLVFGGKLKFYFFPSPEGSIIYANFTFYPGSSKLETKAFADELSRSLKKSDINKAVKLSFTTIGKPVGTRGGVQQETGDHIGGMIVELISPEKRNVLTSQVIESWRNEINMFSGLENLTFLERRGGPPGRDIDIRLTTREGDIKTLKNAAQELSKNLLEYTGISDISDNLPLGKREAVLTLSSRGKALGFTTQDVAEQMRGLLKGITAVKFIRGEDEIDVIVRYDPKYSSIEFFNNIILNSSSMGKIPLLEVVNLEYEQGFSIIRRENGKREVSVTAEIDESIANPDIIIDSIVNQTLSKLKNDYEVDWRLAGRAEEQANTFGDMRIGALVGIVIIYLILAAVFSSYTRPLVVMSIIPFSIVGAFWGHWITGFDLTILSFVALLGLLGIVVNDSIVMVSTIDGLISDGVSIEKAVVEGSSMRLRAVILTSLTTIGGLIPLMFEQSLQAQFLKPMALTLIFGLLITSILVLFIVPALIVLQSDVKKAWKGIIGSKI
tara:strand:- start:1 stop:3111 length:3111 start_codon:yes stop_codon:yes gene_type:complete